TELFRSIVAAARERTPNALVTTPPLTGFTDSHYFRQLGIVSYGLSPFPLNQTESRGVHGNDERVSLDDIAFGGHFVYDIVPRVPRSPSRCPAWTRGSLATASPS